MGTRQSTVLPLRRLHAFEPQEKLHIRRQFVEFQQVVALQMKSNGALQQVGLDGHNLRRGGPPTVTPQSGRAAGSSNRRSPFVLQACISVLSEIAGGVQSALRQIETHCIILLPIHPHTGGAMAEPTYEELKAKLAEMEKQGGARRTGALEFRVGEKGGVSVYGLGRFPVTLYYEQWIRLLEATPQLRAFLEENKAAGKLKLREK